MTHKPQDDLAAGTRRPPAQRLHWVDFAKAIAIILVVLYHVGGDGMNLLFQNADGVGSAFWTTLNTALLPVRMPLFFICSGLLAQAAIARPWRAVWHPRVIVLLWPYLLWSLLFAAVAGFSYQPSDPAGYARWQLVSLPAGVSPYWFLAALVVFFTTAKLLARWSTAVLMVALVLAVLTPVLIPQIHEVIPDPLVHTVIRVGRYAFWYLVGCYAADHIKRLATVRPALLIWGGGTAFVGLAGFARVADHAAELSFVLSAFGLVTAIGVSTWAVRYSRAQPWARYLAARTLPIYLVHPILITLAVLPAVHVFDVARSELLAAVLAPVVTALFIFIAVRLYDRVQGTRAAWVFTAPAPGRRKD